MKKLRPGSTGRSEPRVLFALGPERRAVTLVAGDKPGDWNTWYRKNIPIADEHIEKLQGGL